MGPTQHLEEGLAELGALLARETKSADLVLIGAGALLLLGEIARSTADLDAVARFDNGTLRASRPFPDFLVAAIRRVGAALDLPHLPRDDKDWLNSGPSHLTTLGLPDGFEERLLIRHYDTLTIRIASRYDLIAFKFFAATDAQRANRRVIDRADLQALKPTADEIRHALSWCARVDGRMEFLELDAAPLLIELGFDPRSFADE